MGSVLSSLSSVPATHPTPREMEEIQHQESETFQVECAVCLTDRLIFKKMHHSWSPETGHYVCLGCFRAWKLACTESRSEWPECEQLTCPLCVSEPFASRSTFPQEAMATWPRTIQDALSAGVASQRPRNVPFAGWRVLFWKMTNLNASGPEPNNVPENWLSSCFINCDFHVSILFLFWWIWDSHFLLYQLKFSIRAAELS